MTPDPKRAGDAGNLDAVLRVPLSLTAVLGTRRMAIAEVLKLGIGSVVELDRPASAPVDVLAADKPIARGEIVAVDDRFGVRITELIGRSA